MGGSQLLALLLAAGAAALAGTDPASAQCRLCATPTTTRDAETDEGRVSLQIQTSLDFDRLILSGDGGEGSAWIRPDGSVSAYGSIADISARAMVGTAVVHGEPGRAVRVELPRRIELYAPNGQKVVVDEIDSDLPAVPRLDSVGRLTFRFGGRLKIAGDLDGDYRGDLPITVEYP